MMEEGGSGNRGGGSRLNRRGELYGNKHSYRHLVFTGRLLSKRPGLDLEFSLYHLYDAS